MMLSMLVAIIAAVATAGVVEGQVAQTPPMGWNSWNHYHCDGLNETIVSLTADMMVLSGLKNVGYQYINLDDCWAAPERAGGGLTPDPQKFQNFTGMIAHIKALGLKFGLYTDRGTKTCAGRPGSLDHEDIDAKAFASWGVDYVKNDDCNTPPGSNVTAQYAAMFDAIQATGRPMVHSIKSSQPVETAHLVSNMRRVWTDIRDQYPSMLSLVLHSVSSDLSQYAHPGFWNDLDMLEIGNGGMTLSEYQTHMSYWCILKAPLILGNDLTNVSADVLAILTNEEAIAINQDLLGVQARLVARSLLEHHWEINIVTALQCTEAGTQQWKYDEDKMTLYNEKRGWCMSRDEGTAVVVLSDCIANSTQQQWNYNKNTRQLHPVDSDELCVDVYQMQGPGVTVAKCKDPTQSPFVSGNQGFIITPIGNIRVNSLNNLCLDAGLGGGQLFVFAGPLTGGSVAVMLSSDTPANIVSNVTVTWQDIGLHTDAPYYVRDVWQHKDLGVFENSFTADVLGHEGMLFKLTPV